MAGVLTIRTEAGGSGVPSRGLVLPAPPSGLSSRARAELGDRIGWGTEVLQSTSIPEFQSTQ